MTDRERAERLERLLRIVLRILWQEGYTRLSRQIHRELRALSRKPNSPDASQRGTQVPATGKT